MRWLAFAAAVAAVALVQRVATPKPVKCDLSRYVPGLVVGNSPVVS